MADDQDRRVEPRGAIAGSGMLTDPERIDALQAEAARRERAWRKRSGKGFSAVLEARHEDRDDDSEPEADPEPAAANTDLAEEEAMAAAAQAVPAEISGLQAAPPAAVRRAPPDPRMAALHQLVDGKAPSSQPKRSGRAGAPAGGAKPSASRKNKPSTSQKSTSNKRRSP